MKKIAVLFFALFTGAALWMAAGKGAGGVKFSSEGWGSASKSAKEKNKPIFVFVRTQTCAISSRMDDVFEDPQVAKFFNDNFVSVQIDPDKPMDNIRARNWGATGVPTYVFFDGSKNKVHMARGFKDEAAIVAEAEKALKAAGVSYTKPVMKPSKDGPVQIIESGDDDDEDGE